MTAEASGDTLFRVHLEPEIVAAEGLTSEGVEWAFKYRAAGEDHCISLMLNGAEHDAAFGLDIPHVTEIGFAAGLKPGEGHYFLYGLVTSRIRVVRAEGREAAASSEVETAALEGGVTAGGEALRTFVLVRPPVDDVGALVGLDEQGRMVQRIPFQ